jgi:hypothetical protein
MEENSQNPVPTSLNHYLKYGGILGLIHIVLYVALMNIDLKLLVGFSYIILVMVLNIGFVVYAGITRRADIGGYIGYGAALKDSFLTLLVNGVIGMIFSIILMFAMPDHGLEVAEASLENSIELAQKLGAPEESLDKVRDEFDMDEIASRYTVFGLVKALLISSIFYFIGSLISALFVRKEEPIE